MERYFETLQQPEYVHVLLNHLPLTGLFVALVGLVASICLNHRTALLLALALVAVLSLSAWPVAHFGDKGYDRVLAMADEAGGDYLKHHMELAERWLPLFYVTAAAAAAAIVVGWKKPKYLRPAAGAVAVLAASSLLAGAVIADYGGQVRHREFRHGLPPSAGDTARE
jgi:hypothetical protein